VSETLNEAARRLRSGLPSECPRCGAPSRLGICPYAADVDGVGVECGCCDGCRDECAREV
jgi:hypothetical protein